MRISDWSSDVCSSDLADIVTSEERAQLLVPNAALRFSPERDAARASRGENGGVTSVLVPRRGRRGRGGGDEQVTIGRVSRQTVYDVGENGQPQPNDESKGPSDGRRTAGRGEGREAGHRGKQKRGREGKRG